jgi:hypothetical protein
MGDRQRREGEPSEVPLVYADFNDLGWPTKDSITLSKPGSVASMRLHGITLSEGMLLHLWNSDHGEGDPIDALVADATAHQDVYGNWWALLTSSCLYISELPDREHHWSSYVDWEEEEERLNRGVRAMNRF